MIEHNANTCPLRYPIVQVVGTSRTSDGGCFGTGKECQPCSSCYNRVIEARVQGLA